MVCAPPPGGLKLLIGPMKCLGLPSKRGINTRTQLRLEAASGHTQNVLKMRGICEDRHHRYGCGLTDARLTHCKHIAIIFFVTLQGLLATQEWNASSFASASIYPLRWHIMHVIVGSTRFLLETNFWRSSWMIDLSMFLNLLYLFLEKKIPQELTNPQLYCRQPDEWAKVYFHCMVLFLYFFCVIVGFLGFLTKCLGLSVLKNRKVSRVLWI